MRYKEFLLISGREDTELERVIWDIKQIEKAQKKLKEQKEKNKNEKSM